VKSINAKKIAAVTFGAALLGASFVAAAPIMYKNTQIINEQGKPVVKIVVGANAKASDGVAAANIAAVIGSLAYQSKTVSAKLIGSPTCTVTGTGTGTCQVLDKKVTLEITTPGTATVAGGYGFRTYGYGFIDGATTEDNQIHNGAVPKKISGDDMSSLADYKSSISSVSGAFTETQEMYVLQTNDYPKYDSDSKKYYIHLDTLNYTMKFDHDTFGGIPICVKESELLSGNCSAENKIERQRLKIKFLGQEWVVAGMTNGSSIVLAKESIPSQIIYVGNSITAGAYTIKLAGLTAPDQGGESKAIVEIYDANNQPLVQEIVDPKSTTGREISLSNNDKITIRVYKTAPSYNQPASSWAEMAVYSQTLELKNNSKIDDDKNKNWTVKLGWDSTGTYGNRGVLKSITLTRTNFDDVYEGGSVNIIESPTPFQFKFAGWTLTDAQRDTLKVEYKRISNYVNSSDETQTIPIADVNRSFVCFTSDKKAFDRTDFGGDLRSEWCYGVESGLVLYNKPDKGYVNATPIDVTNSSQNVTVDYKINDDSSYDRSIFIVPVNSTPLGANITIYEEALKGDPADTDDIYFKFFFHKDDKKFYKEVGSTNTDDIIAGEYTGSSGVINQSRTVGYVSQRGSKIASRSSTAITLKMAKKLGELQYFIMPSSSSVEAGTSTQTLSEGQQVTVQDSTVKVKQISATGGVCSVSGGEAACTPSSAGMSAVLDVAGTPASTTCVVPYNMSATDRLVVLDSEAPSAESLILVGGHLVNTLTASAIAGTDVKFDKPGVKIVSAVSDNRIVVAGYTEQDTQEAASQFISALLAQVK
jgi:hypothetical protein